MCKLVKTMPHAPKSTLRIEFLSNERQKAWGETQVALFTCSVTISRSHRVFLEAYFDFPL